MCPAISNSQPVVTVRDVCFSYRRREILHNVNLEIPAGSMTAIVGPNGGGKTTLLHLMLGLLQPDRGQIALLGCDPVLRRSEVGYVPQKLDLDRNFPVNALEVVRMGFLAPKRRWAWGQSLRKRALELLVSTGAEHLAQQAFSELSGGERQRVLIARALASDPSLLLLDEPTANVDPRSEHEIYELFRELNQRIPIVFVSHNLNVVSQNVSHVICVNRTAAMHAIDDVLESTFTELYGGKLALIHHGNHCHVNDPSHALSQPHGSHEGCKHDSDSHHHSDS
ncbi:MAG: ABC transporter ATP-binding protein [Puniceicoccaceae bacterium]